MEIDRTRLFDLRKKMINKIYHFYKGGLYQVLNIAVDAQTNEIRVIYQSVSDNFIILDCLLRVFRAEVNHEKYPDCKQVHIFEQVNFLQ